MKSKKISIKDKFKMVKLSDIVKGLEFNIYYTSKNNYFKEQIYPDDYICLLRAGTALKLSKCQRHFRKLGYRIVIYDAYRPFKYQEKIWNIYPNPIYIAPPDAASDHNRGTAIDISLVDDIGKEIQMGSTFDYFSDKSSHNFMNLSRIEIENRKLLKNTMEHYGFNHEPSEWWHYSDKESLAYEVMDFDFDTYNS